MNATELLGQKTLELANLQQEYKNLLMLMHRVQDGKISLFDVELNMDGLGSWKLTEEAQVETTPEK